LLVAFGVLVIKEPKPHDASDYKNHKKQTQDPDAIKKETTYAGDEIVDGRLCEIRQGSLEINGNQIPYKVWIAKEINFPLKMEANNSLTRFKNIQVNIALEDSLFTLPAGVQVISMPAMPASGLSHDIQGLKQGTNRANPDMKKIMQELEKFKQNRSQEK